MRRRTVLVLLMLGLVVLLRRDPRPARRPHEAPPEPVAETTVTPTELAVTLWGPAQRSSQSWGSRRVRSVARELYGAPGPGGQWRLTPAQANAIRGALARVTPPRA